MATSGRLHSLSLENEILALRRSWPRLRWLRERQDPLKDAVITACLEEPFSRDLVNSTAMLPSGVSIATTESPCLFRMVPMRCGVRLPDPEATLAVVREAVGAASQAQ